MWLFVVGLLVFGFRCGFGIWGMGKGELGTYTIVSLRRYS